MPKKSDHPEKPRKGRPKGSGPGAMEGRFVVKITPEYKAWMSDFAKRAGGTEADLFREAMREYAVASSFRKPPLR